MKVLRSRLYEIELQRQHDEIAQDRRSQVGTGERSEKVRTYNFPQNRVTDHRIGFTTHRLVEMLNGDLTEISGALTTYFPRRDAQALGAGPRVVIGQQSAADCEWVSHKWLDRLGGARRPTGKARRGSIPAVFDRGGNAGRRDAPPGKCPAICGTHH